MKKCIICDSEISEEAKTCPVCGFQTKYPSPMLENKYRNWLSTAVEPYQIKYQLRQLQRELSELKQAVHDMKGDDGQSHNANYEINELKRAIREFRLENLYLKQEIAPLDPKKLDQASAEKWYQEGKKYYDKEEYEKAVEWFCKAAEQYHAASQYYIGECYYFNRGIPQNFPKALAWYRKAAAQNYTEAQLRLGYCYLLGEGAAEDDTEAVKWYREAAQQNDPEAQYQLGYCCRWGKGTAMNLQEAISWYTKAAQNGHSSAKYALEKLQSE